MAASFCRRAVSLSRWRTPAPAPALALQPPPPLLSPYLPVSHLPDPSPIVPAFSSILATWENLRSSCRSIYTPPPASPHFLHQQVRRVYVEVIDNDIDAAVKFYRKKMLNTKVEEKLREKRYYSKPSERRKLAKHYKKLNRARRELSEKIRTVKHRMEKIQEVRKIEKEEKRARAAAAAAASQGQNANIR